MVKISLIITPPKESIHVTEILVSAYICYNNCYFYPGKVSILINNDQKPIKVIPRETSS